ncbi:hypothetical protein KAI04_04935 [Candidatus Pacearchaeota archaeon]|nr:hypothetical protein [Candidatus Pacearchaeota archaeon]
METIKVKIEGTAPLLMHRFAEEEASMKSARTKRVYIAEDEAEKAAYRNTAGKLCLPTRHFKASMTKAGVELIFKGRKTYKDYIKSGIIFKEVETVLDQQKYVIDSVPAVINRARIMRHRPRFDKWSCEFEFDIIDEALDVTNVKQILESAGKYKGVGDNRPEFGRFKVTEFKKIK